MCYGIFMKSFRELEHLVRGFSNHRRIQILQMLKKAPEMSVEEIAEVLNINFRTSSEHLRRLATAGLVMKRNDSTSVRHRLTDRGETILLFLGTLK